MEALLNLGAWKNAKEVMDRMPEFFATTQKKIALTLCNLVHYMMEPVYRAYVSTLYQFGNRVEMLSN